MSNITVTLPIEQFEELREIKNTSFTQRQIHLFAIWIIHQGFQYNKEENTFATRTIGMGYNPGYDIEGLIKAFKKDMQLK